jgi:transcriptional regulator with XRE-family HTH domain
MAEKIIQLQTPEEVGRTLARRVKELRLLAGWKQATLAARSGVTLASLKRFEYTGKASLENLLRLCHALGRLDEFDQLLRPPAAQSLAELEARTSVPMPKRGRR